MKIKKDDINLNQKFSQYSKYNEQFLNFYFEQSIDGVFFMMLDEPVEWNDNIDKVKTLDYLMKNHKLTRVNDAMLAQYQANRDDFLNLTPVDFFSHNLEKGKKHFREFFDKGHLHLDTVEKRFDGSEMIIEGDYFCLYDEQKRILGHFGVQRDVTLVREAENKIKSSEEKYRYIVENGTDLFFQFEPNGKLTYISNNWKNVLGYQPDEIIGIEIGYLIHPDDLENNQRYLLNLLNGNSTENKISYRIKHKDGSWRWHKGSVKPNFDLDNNLLHFTGNCHDITIEKQNEIELRDNEKKYRFIVENIYDMVYHLDLVGVFTYMSYSFTKLMGYELDEIIGHTFMHLIHPDDLHICLSAVQNSILNQVNVVHVTYRIKHKDGSWKWHESNATPVIGENGNVLYLNGVARDITNTKEKDEEIKKHYANLLAVIENIDDIICLRDTNHNVIVYNESFNNICKELFNTNAYKGINTLELLPKDAQDFWNGVLTDVLKGNTYKSQFDWDYGNGDKRYYEIAYRPIFIEKQIIGYSEITRDITLHKINEIKLKEQNNFLIENEKKLKRTNKILDSINYLQNSLLTDTFSDIIFEEALNKYLELTDSEYGFIGEIIGLDSDSPFLKTKAITNISWNEETKKFYEENASQGLEFRNLQTLFGEVIKTQQPIIANNPKSHPKSSGLPKGHPALHAFLGLPLLLNKTIVGMIGISNRPDGYDEALISELEPLTSTIARLIETHHSKLQLKKVEEKTISIINSMDDMIFVLDKNYTYLEMHQPKSDDLYLDPKDFLGKTYLDVKLPEPAFSKILGALKSCFEINTIQNINYYLDLPKGRQWFDLKVTPLKDAIGHTEGAVCVIRNITDIKLKEEELIYISTQMQGINNALNTSTIVSIADLKGNIIKMNDLFCEVSGYSPQELLGKNHNIVNSNYHTKSFWKQMWATIKSGKPWRGEVRNKRKDGEFYWVDTVINPIFDESGIITQYLSIRNLITERKVAEEELRNSEDNFRTLFDILPVGITITDFENNVLEANNYSEVITGLSKNELTNKYTLSNKWIPLRPDGSNMPYDEFASYKAKLENRAIYDVEMGLKKSNGDINWIIVNSAPLPNNRVVIAYQDVTKLKKYQNELKETITNLEERNNSLQNFAHIVSHNLRSHSANISGLLSLIVLDNSELLENQYYELLSKSTENLMESIKHLSEVAQLHTNAKKDLTKISLNDSLNNTKTNIYALAVSSGVKIIDKISNNSNIIGEQAYIDSILLNFLTNSIKYKSKDKDSFVRLTTYIENEHLVLVIQDNGLGIDLERHSNKLFGMFKTFHDHPEARGIGLFITNNQVKAIGGKIEVESKVGEGTTFRIYFKNANTQN